MITPEQAERIVTSKIRLARYSNSSQQPEFRLEQMSLANWIEYVLFQQIISHDMHADMVNDTASMNNRAYRRVFRT